MKTEAAQAAALIRKELKAAGIKARVTSKNYAGGNSIRVKLTNELPATVEAIKLGLGKYEAGHFDGMTDMYEYSNRNADLPQVKFLFVENELSEEIKQACWEYVKRTWGDMEGAPESYADAWQHQCRNGCGRDLLHRELRETRGGFWKEYKQRVRA